MRRAARALVGLALILWIAGGFLWYYDKYVRDVHWVRVATWTVIIVGGAVLAILFAMLSKRHERRS